MPTVFSAFEPIAAGLTLERPGRTGLRHQIAHLEGQVFNKRQQLIMGDALGYVRRGGQGDLTCS